MSRVQVFENIYAQLRADTTLPTLLGAESPQNPRILRAYPQLQEILTTPPGYEPSGGEGWLVFLENKSAIRAENTQRETIYEVWDIYFSVYATRYSIGDDVGDVLDQYWHWSVEQQRDVTYGDRIVLFSRRLNTYEEYAEEIKLYTKTHWFEMTFVQTTQIA